LVIRDSVESQLVAVSALGRSGDSVISWYSCGPTVYDHSHVGHARAYVTIDCLQRLVQYLTGRRIQHLLGMTDIDDKILRAAATAGVTPRELAQRFEQEFHEDMLSLGVARPAAVLRVSEHIPEIIDMATKLQQDGFAYPGATTGSLYFDIDQFQSRLSRYQRLVPCFHNPTASGPAEEAVGEDGVRQEKRNPADFVLWKVRNPAASSDSLEHASCLWSSPWGLGRPGWHIECSAMVQATLGRELDVHAGGIDLAFPHHANEIAQTQAFHQDGSLAWPRCFIHVGHVFVEGQKMSKSLKNFTTIRECLRAHSADAFRMFCLQNHYRSRVEYADTRLEEAQNVLDRLEQFRIQVDSLLLKAGLEQINGKWSPADQALWEVFAETTNAVALALRRDFDTPMCIKALMKLVSSAFSYLAAARPNLGLLSVIRDYLAQLLTQAFGLGTMRPAAAVDQQQVAPAVRSSLVQVREQLRILAKNQPSLRGELYPLSDTLRDSVLKPLGIDVVDRS
jgi:cysteinyl-tRNA synthetase